MWFSGLRVVLSVSELLPSCQNFASYHFNFFVCRQKTYLKLWTSPELYQSNLKALKRFDMFVS